MPQSGFHGLVGLATARALISRVPALTRTAFVFGTVLGSMLPDIDMYPASVASLLSSSQEQKDRVLYLIHRTASHSVTFLVLLFLIGLFAGSKPTWRWAFWGLTIGAVTHDILDIFFWFAQIDLMWPFSSVTHGSPIFNIVNIWPKADGLDSGLVPNIRDAFESAAFALFLMALRRIVAREPKLGSALRAQVWWERALWLHFLVALCTAFAFSTNKSLQQYVIYPPFLLAFLPYCWSRVWVYRGAITSWAVGSQWSWIDWGGSVGCNPVEILYPKTEQDIVDIVVRARANGLKVRVFGAGHSWSPVVPTDGVLVSLDNLQIEPVIDPGAKTATVHGGMRLRDIGPLLMKHKLTFRNLGAITPQSIAGAMSTGTHGTGPEFGMIGTQVSAIRVVDGTGQIRDFNALDHPREMSALRLSLGALGIITRVTIDCVRDYNVRLCQERKSFDEFIAAFDDLYVVDKPNKRIRAYWFPGSKNVLVQTMEQTDEAVGKSGSIYGWFEALVLRGIVMGFLWWLGRTFNALIHCCNGFIEAVGYKKKCWPVGHCFYAITTPVPPQHQEAEIAVPVELGRQAVIDYHNMMGRYKLNVQSEIRFSDGDDILLSPANRAADPERSGRYCYIGGYTATYIPNDPFFADFCRKERNPEGIPHWGKLGAPDRATALAIYGPKLAEFAKIRSQFDPHGVFANEYITELFDLVH